MGTVWGMLARTFLDKAGVASGFSIIFIGVLVFLIKKAYDYKERRATEFARERQAHALFLQNLMARAEAREKEFMEVLGKMTSALEVIKTSMATDQKLAMERHRENQEQFKTIDGQHDMINRDIWKASGKRNGG